MVTSDEERDFLLQNQMRRPGRLDFKTLQNIPDVGDGFPGLQRAIRNYILNNLDVKAMVRACINDIFGADGKADKDIDLDNHDIQKIKNLDVDGICDIEGAVDINSTLDIHNNLETHNNDLKDVKAIDGGGDPIIFNDDINLPLKNITLGASQTVDGVDISAISLSNMPTPATGDIGCDGQAITNVGVVDTIDVANHVHNNTAGNGVTIPGQLLHWKDDYDDAGGNTTSATYINTNASVTINLSEDSTVILHWRSRFFSLTAGVGYICINDGSDITATQQDHSFQGSFDHSSGYYIGNYAAGSHTWTIRVKSDGLNTATWEGLALTVMAFKQITSS